MPPPQEVSTGDHPPAMFDSETFNLDRYIQFRPQYPPALFEEIYSHHRNHGCGKWDLAHDAGTGPGVVAQELSKHFATVAVSDPSLHYLEVARARLETKSSGKKYDQERERERERFLFGHYPAEDMSTWLAPSSVDMVTIAEAIHWMEYDKVITSALHVLKPGGTLAIWVYGTCPFLDRNDSKDAQQDLLDRIHSRWEKRVVEKTCGSSEDPDRVVARLRRASQVLRSHLDVVRLDDESGWKPGSVRRIRWNSSRQAQGIYDMFGEDQHRSFIGRNDVVVDNKLDDNDKNDGQLTEEVDVRWIRGYFDHLYPDLPADDPASEELFSKLEEALGGPDRKTGIRWVSSMILATKA
jgi:SAM-dependent methyltransferase